MRPNHGHHRALWGEEFAIILPESTPVGTDGRGKDQVEVAAHNFIHNSSESVQLTVSVGVYSSVNGRYPKIRSCPWRTRLPTSPRNRKESGGREGARLMDPAKEFEKRFKAAVEKNFDQSADIYDCFEERHHLFETLTRRNWN